MIFKKQIYFPKYGRSQKSCCASLKTAMVLSILMYFILSFHFNLGVVTFSDRATHSIKMKEHTDIASFNAAVDAIPLMGSLTRIDRALKLAQKELFAVESGGRSEVRDILILMTDGTQTKSNVDERAEDPGDIMDEIRFGQNPCLSVFLSKGSRAKAFNGSCILV